jgi:TPR repeat protein
VEKNLKEAIKWFRRAAEHDNPHAQFSLGEIYSGDEYGLKDDKEAFKWYRMAAEEDYVGAQAKLGLMYHTGRGVAQDNMQAYAWDQIAAINGYAAAKRNQNLISRGMTPEQRTQAEALAKAMIKKNPKLAR